MNIGKGLSHSMAGLATVIVGYTSSVIIVIQAAEQLGAPPTLIASWLLALGIAMGLSTMFFSWRYKVPVLTAWSTPGAAMIIGLTTDATLAEAVGAFLFSAVLLTASGWIKPITRAISHVPAPLASALLAAIVLPFCLRAISPASTDPEIFWLMLVTFLVAKRWLPKYAMAGLLLAGIGCASVFSDFGQVKIDLSVAPPQWITPEFDLSAIINIGLPLYIITMLTQNLPGIAMLQRYNYEAPTQKLLSGIGVFNIAFVPLGGYAINLAAISAAMCMGKDVDEDPAQRYKAAIWAGGFYILAGLWATAVVAVFQALPSAITQILAGLALLGTLMLCLQGAFAPGKFRDAAIVTFIVSLSDITVFGIGATIWGLMAGGLIAYRDNRQAVSVETGNIQP